MDDRKTSTSTPGTAPGTSTGTAQTPKPGTAENRTHDQRASGQRQPEQRPGGSSAGETRQDETRHGEHSGHDHTRHSGEHHGTDASRAKARKVLIAGLKNAHAVEKQSAATLRPQIDRLEHYPELRQRIREHLEETYEQEKRLEIVLRKLDASPSFLKDVTLSLMGSGQQSWQFLSDDTVIKNTLADSMVEHFEVATYRALFTLAELAGEEAVVEDLKPSLREEEAMAEWLDEHLPGVVRSYVMQEVAGDRAEREAAEERGEVDGIPGWLRADRAHDRTP